MHRIQHLTKSPTRNSGSLQPNRGSLQNHRSAYLMNNANVASISNFYSTERFAQSLRNVMPGTSALASGPGLNTVTNL